MRETKSARDMLHLYQRLSTCYDQELRPFAKRNLENDIIKERKILEKILQFVTSPTSCIHKWYDETTALLDSFSEQVNILDEPLRLFVIGGGNTGKSTLINTLVGEEIAATDILPKTWRLDIYKNSDDNNVILRYADGSIKTVTRNEAKTEIEYADKEAEELNKKIQKQIKILRMQDFDKKKEDIEKEKILKKYNTLNGLVEVIWNISSNSFLREFTLVDTPGMNQVLYNTNIRKDAHAYYEKANGILWILPADKLSDRNTYEEVNKMSSSFQDKGDHTIAILNKFECAETPEERNELLKDAQQKYGGKNGYFSTIIPYSARDNWKFIKRNDTYPQEVEDLIQFIRDKFLRERQKIQIDDIRDKQESIKKSIISLTKELKSISSYKKILLEKQKEDWKNLLGNESIKFISQMNALLSNQENDLYYRAKSKENKLQELDDKDKSDFLRNQILDRVELCNQYQKLKDDILRYMNFISEQYSKKYTKKIREDIYNTPSRIPIFISKDNYIIPDDLTKYLDQRIEQYLSILFRRMPFDSWAIGNFFRFFGFFKISDKIKDAYKDRFKEINKKLEQDIKYITFKYIEKMNEIIYDEYESILFKENCYPIITEYMNDIINDTKNWRIKSPHIVYLLKKEVP